MFFRILTEKEGEGEFRLRKEAEARSNIFTILCEETGLYSSGSRELVRSFKRGKNTIGLAFWIKHREEGRLERRETDQLRPAEEAPGRGEKFKRQLRTHIQSVLERQLLKPVPF